ncbi:MAG TPA: class I SAM-dependent methyltransferase [Thermoanaerobaculia bacterium]|nr:class I SAM-dependent methyltransferase [Thermoanaerobaculia bacterium]
MDLPGIQRSRKTRAMRRVFGRIHAARAWGECESFSGPGSTRERAASFLGELIALVQSLGVSTLLDVPCGDFNWAGPLADSVQSYVGIDVVPALIKENVRRWAAPNRVFLCRDLVNERLPAGHLILCRDALVHLSTADAVAALANFRRTGAEYLIATTFVGERSNADIVTGGWRPLNMERAPYNFPPPLTLLDERCDHTGGIYGDKRLGLWRFHALPC